MKNKEEEERSEIVSPPVILWVIGDDLALPLIMARVQEPVFPQVVVLNGVKLPQEGPKPRFRIDTGRIRTEDFDIEVEYFFDRGAEFELPITDFIHQLSVPAAMEFYWKKFQYLGECSYEPQVMTFVVITYHLSQLVQHILNNRDVVALHRLEEGFLGGFPLAFIHPLFFKQG